MSKGLLFMLVSVLSFSVTHVCVKYLSHIPFFELVFFRSLISFVLTFWAIKRSKLSLWGKNRKGLFFRGFAGTLALCGYFYTIQEIPLATAVTIQYLSPMTTLIIASLFLKEKALPIQWFFFLFAFIGVLFVKGLDHSVALVPFGIGLLSAVGSGIAYNLVRHLRKSEHELVIVFYFPLVTLPLLFPFTWIYWVTPNGEDWGFIILLGLFTQIAQVFMTKSYKMEQASKVSIVNYLGIAIAALVGWFGFSEEVTMTSLFGIAVIFLSVIGNTWIGLKTEKRRV